MADKEKQFEIVLNDLTTSEQIMLTAFMIVSELKNLNYEFDSHVLTELQKIHAWLVESKEPDYKEEAPDENA